MGTEAAEDAVMGVPAVNHMKQFVGGVELSVDYEVSAISVTLVGEKIASTEDLGNGFLIDRNAEGEVVSVEIIAPSGGPGA